MGILDKIIASKRAELPELRSRALPTPPSHRPSVHLWRDTGTNRERSPLNLVCEIKKKSPSAGSLSTKLSVTERARQYAQGGATMISVLCDGPFFDGAYTHLLEARSGCDIPLLCKEFVIDECQLDAAQAYGASAVLLIVRCLQPQELSTFISASVARGLLPLVEVFNPHEAQQALDAGATCIGVNARDLNTLKMNSANAAAIVDSLPPSITAMHLSGVKTPADVRKVAQGRSDAALIGEVLMREDHPLPLLTQLVAATEPNSP